MTEKEWRMFNDILLEIYYAGNLKIWRKMFKADSDINSIYTGIFFSD